MLWLILAISAAFFESMKDVFSKFSLKKIDEWVVAWALSFIAAVCLFPVIFFAKIPPLGNQFWIALLIAGSLSAAATVIYMKALKSSDLSLSIPMLAFTPLFLLLSSPILLGEFPNFLGLTGVLLIVVGSYTLNIKEKHKGYLAPFKALIKEKGPMLMLCVAFIWSIGSNFDKIGVKNSSPVFWSFASNAFVGIVMIPIMLYKAKNINKIPSRVKLLFPIGLFKGITSLFQMIAINLTLVAYVISIKRTSIIISVLLGFLIFREKNIKERLAGAAIMIVGILFIALS